MLKKNDLHENVWQLVVNHVKGHDRSGRPDEKTWLRVETRTYGRRSSNARQLGCVFQDMKPPKSILQKSTDMQKPIQRVKFTKAIARHAKFRDKNPSLGIICPGELHQHGPNAPNFEDRSQEGTEWQEHWARKPAWKLAKKILKLKEKQKSTFFSPSEKWCLPSPSKNQSWGKRIYCGLRRVDAHDTQEGFVFRRIGDCHDFQVSDDSQNRQWRSADAWRGNCLRQRIGYLLDSENRRRYASSLFARKALRGSRIFIWKDQRSTTMSH